MKRPPGLWILLSAGVLWLSLQDVYGIRATALIFAKSSTSTTTEVPTSALPEENNNEETGNSTEPLPSTNNTSNTNSTRPALTGIPQVDYIWDPNLPKELNGYNLSEYPFYERVPEDLDFKCDGLHDGFYASVPHKCQVYHHCLFGTRFDFLCANYTAFDQRTFICHFVSEVDCLNSKKFWHRNDALYQAQSTTTTAPLNLRAAIYTTAPPDGADPITPLLPRRPAGGGARRPYRPTRRRRPQFEYYDDEYYDDEYYDERPRANRGRKRPRPRPRPAYDDEEYEEYEDERYESRRTSGRRRPYRRRNKDRKKPEYDDEEEDVEERFEDDDFVAAHKRQKPDERRTHPTDDDDDEEDRNRKRPSEKRRPSSPSSDNERKPPRKGSGNRRPIYDDEYEDEPSQSDEERPRKKQKGNKDEPTNNDGRPIIKPATGTIYDRPRVAPRINLPVPKNAADKFSYQTIGGHSTSTSSITSAPSVEEQYSDEEYEEPLPKDRNRRPPSERKREKPKIQSTTSKPKAKEPDIEEDVKPKYGSTRNRHRASTTSRRKPPVSEEEYDEEENLDEVPERRASLKNEKKSTTTTTTPESPPLKRIIKRPFLPSRGGSPYSPRGLQPIGLKAVSENDSEANNEDVDYIEDNHSKDIVKIEEEEDNQTNRKPAFKPSPALINVPVRPKYTPPSAEAQELIEIEPSRQQNKKTQKPKILEKDPLDLNEYDVTLNDALNPTLPNLPVRAFPTGFSSAGGDYNYNTFTRPRYVLEPVISSSNQNFAVPNKVVRSQQRFEGVPHSQYSTINGQYRQQHGQTQAIYSGY